MYRILLFVWQSVAIPARELLLRLAFSWFGVVVADVAFGVLNHVAEPMAIIIITLEYPIGDVEELRAEDSTFRQLKTVFKFYLGMPQASLKNFQRARLLIVEDVADVRR